MNHFDPKPNPLPLAKLPLNESHDTMHGHTIMGHFPQHLHRPALKGSRYAATALQMHQAHHHTVCQEAKCPNRLECWSKNTATFLALGKDCTRNCGFCDIDFNKMPAPPDPTEPEKIADSVVALGLRHAVITMVARDDLADGGATHIGQIITAIRHKAPGVSIEVLVSDLNGAEENIDHVLQHTPEIFNHNIETVERLSPKVRHKATYDRTLSVLAYAVKNKRAGFVKSGLMVGLGEERFEVEATLRDLRAVGCDIVTIGHYLQASPKKLKVANFVSQENFDYYASFGKSLGFAAVYSGPFVRSSYNAAELFSTLQTPCIQ